MEEELGQHKTRTTSKIKQCLTLDELECLIKQEQKVRLNSVSLLLSLVFQGLQRPPQSAINKIHNKYRIL